MLKFYKYIAIYYPVLYWFQFPFVPNYIEFMSTTRFITILALWVLGSCSGDSDINWDVYLGDLSSSQYKDITEITKENVSGLQVAWTYDGGQADPENRSTGPGIILKLSVA